MSHAILTSEKFLPVKGEGNYLYLDESTLKKNTGFISGHGCRLVAQD